MTVVEIVLLIIGFACVCISFFVTGKKEMEQSGQAGEEVTTASLWTEKEEQMIQERVTELLQEKQTELVDATADQMNRLCNDKIMAVDEFSKQLLEKIEANHQEVVFMYNLLNEKEKEVKEIVTEPVIRTAEPKVKQTPVSGLEKVAQKQDNQKASAKEKKENSAVSSPAVPQKKAGNVKQAGQPKKIEEPLKEPEDRPIEAIANVHGDVNLKIQKMHKEGKSILEISKALNMGQGEVKLVIALYGGKSR